LHARLHSHQPFVAGFEEVGGTGSEKSASEELPVGDNPGVTACAPAAASTFAN